MEQRSILANIGFDEAENEPSKVISNIFKNVILYIFSKEVSKTNIE